MCGTEDELLIDNKSYYIINQTVFHNWVLGPFESFEQAQRNIKNTISCVSINCYVKTGGELDKYLKCVDIL